MHRLKSIRSGMQCKLVNSEMLLLDSAWIDSFVQIHPRSDILFWDIFQSPRWGIGVDL